MFERILLAVDGSEHGYKAARTAADLARAMKSEKLRIVVAFDKIPHSLANRTCNVPLIAVLLKRRRF